MYLRGLFRIYQPYKSPFGVWLISSPQKVLLVPSSCGVHNPLPSDILLSLSFSHSKQLIALYHRTYLYVKSAPYTEASETAIDSLLLASHIRNLPATALSRHFQYRVYFWAKQKYQTQKSSETRCQLVHINGDPLKGQLGSTETFQYGAEQRA